MSVTSLHENETGSPSPEEEEVARALRAHALFDGVGEDWMERLAAQSDLRAYEPGQTILTMGQYDGGDFFVIVSGAIRVSAVDARSGAIVVEEHKAGDVFPLEAAIGDEGGVDLSRLAVMSAGSSRLIGVDSETLREAFAGDPRLARNIAMALARDLAGRRLRAREPESPPAQRVVQALVERAVRDGAHWRIDPMPRHRELSDVADVDEGEAASVVATLIQEGIVERDYPALVVKDYARLRECAGLT